MDCRTGAFAFSGGWGTFLTNDFRNCNPRGDQSFNPISLVCKLSEVEGRPAVKLSDNFAKAMGPPEEIERYRRIFGTEGHRQRARGSVRRWFSRSVRRRAAAGAARACPWRAETRPVAQPPGR